MMQVTDKRRPWRDLRMHPAGLPTNPGCRCPTNSHCQLGTHVPKCHPDSPTKPQKETGGNASRIPRLLPPTPTALPHSDVAPLLQKEVRLF